MTAQRAKGVLAARGLDTREGVLRAYGDAVAAKWGEDERESGLRLKDGQSYGLILNSLVYYDLDAVDEELAAAALIMLTRQDARALRSGG